MHFESLQQLGMLALSFSIASILAVATGLGTRYLVARTKNEKWIAALGRLQIITMGAVKEVQQTFVSKLESKDKDAMEQAKRAALASILTHLGPRGVKEIRQVFGWEPMDVQTNIASKIEECVHDLKKEGEIP